MNPSTYLANTRYSSTPAANFQDTTTPPVAPKNDHFGALTIHSTSHESTVVLDKIGLKETPIHWLDTLEQKFNAGDESIYPSNQDLYKLRLRKKEFKQFILYLISHKDTLMNTTSPLFISRGTEDLPYTLLYVPKGVHQGAYISLKEHLLSEVGSGAFNKATYCCSINKDPGKGAIFRCGRFHSVPFSEVKIMSILTDFEDFFVTGPCFNYKGSCAPRSFADAQIAGVDFEEEIPKEFSDPKANRETKLRPRVRCHSIGHEILSKSTFKEDEKKEKQIVNKIGFVLDSLHDLDDYIAEPRELETTLEIMVKTAISLCVLHENCKFVHLDLKPGNIFLTKELNPKLADFGLSVKNDEQVKTGGTPDFCAPELMRDLENYTANYAADVWSFGVTLIYMLGGKKAWQKVIDNHANTSDVTLRYEKITKELLYFIKKQYKNDPLACQIINVIEKCLTIEPESRINIYDALIELNHILKPKLNRSEGISPYILADKLEKKLPKHNFKLDYLKEFKPEKYSDEELTEILSLCVKEKFHWTKAKEPFFIPFQGNFFKGIAYIPNESALYLLKANSAKAYEVNINENEPFINEFFNTDKHFRTTLLRKVSEKELAMNTRLIDSSNYFVVGPKITYGENKNKKIGFLLDLTQGKLSSALHVPGKFSKEKILEFITHLVNAIKVLDDLNIVHCNLNPNTIWLSKNLEPRIGSFSQCEDKGEIIANYKAKNQFNAPEMYKPQFEITSAIDVWGLGMTILHLFGWQRNTKFSICSNFSYLQFLSNRHIVFKELKAKFGEKSYYTQMIELMEGCLEEDPTKRLKIEQLIEKMNFIRSSFSSFEEKYRKN